MTEKNPAPGDLTEREWTFMYRQVSGTKLSGRWITHQNEEVVYAQIPRGAVPGAIYEVCTEDGHRAVTDGAKWTGRRTGHVEAAKWRLRDEAEQSDFKVEGAHRKLGALDSVREDLGRLTLNQIRSVMATANRHDRAALISVVLREIGAA